MARKTSDKAKEKVAARKAHLSRDPAVPWAAPVGHLARNTLINRGGGALRADLKRLAARFTEVAGVPVTIHAELFNDRHCFVATLKDLLGDECDFVVYREDLLHGLSSDTQLANLRRHKEYVRKTADMSDAVKLSIGITNDTYAALIQAMTVLATSLEASNVAPPALTPEAHEAYQKDYRFAGRALMQAENPEFARLAATLEQLEHLKDRSEILTPFHVKGCGVWNGYLVPKPDAFLPKDYQMGMDDHLYPQFQEALELLAKMDAEAPAKPAKGEVAEAAEAA